MIINYDKYRRFYANLVPVRHKRKDLTKIDVRLSKGYRDAIRDIGDMDRTLGSFVLAEKDYTDLVQEAHAVNAHWSTKIEGNRMSLREVEESSRMMMRSEGIVRATDPGNQQEILNHLYSYYVPGLFRLPWDTGTVSAVHRYLLTGTGEDCVPGRIRTDGEEVHVVAGGQEVFIGCPSVHVMTELSDLMEWLRDSPLEGIVTAVVFFHEIESIHPFLEGNGRMGRSLFHILMQELGYRNFNLCKIDDKLLGDGDVYYNLLRYTDKTGDYSPLVEFFIDCIQSAYGEAVREFGEKDVLKGLDLNSRQLAIRAKERKEWFTMQEASSWADGIGDQSVRNKLNALADMGVLEKQGKTRSMTFRFNDPFRRIRESLGDVLPESD